MEKCTHTDDEIATITRGDRQRTALRWAKKAFGADQATSLHQRGLRLLEEAVELFQACVASANRADVNMQNGRRKAHELVDFVFGREIGQIEQELGGVSVCMLVLAEAANVSVDAEEARELKRVLSKPIEEFTKRNAAKNAAGFLAASPGPGAEPALTSNGGVLHLATRYSNERGPTQIECSCGSVFAGQNPDDEYAIHLTAVKAAGAPRDPSNYSTTFAAHAFEKPRLPTEVEQLASALRREHENFNDMRKQRDEALDKVGALTRLNVMMRPATARELHGTTTHLQLAETICNLMYENCGVCDMNVYGTMEKLDRCIVANMLADELVKGGEVLLTPYEHQTRISKLTMSIGRIANAIGASAWNSDGSDLPDKITREFQRRGTIVDSRIVDRLEAELISVRNTLRRVEENNEIGKLVAQVDRPVEMFLNCPLCGARHIDVGEFATKPHHTHACQSCGLSWRPAIGPTVGVQYLPGFKNAPVSETSVYAAMPTKKEK